MAANCSKYWCRLRDSNPRPSDYKSDAIATNGQYSLQVARFGLTNQSDSCLNSGNWNIFSDKPATLYTGECDAG
jgi:hypothetical protein